MNFIKWLYDGRIHEKDPFLAKIIWERERDPCTFKYLESLNMINVHGHIALPLIEKDRVSLDSCLGRPGVYDPKTGECIYDPMIGELLLYKNLYCKASAAVYPIVRYVDILKDNERKMQASASAAEHPAPEASSSAAISTSCDSFFKAAQAAEESSEEYAKRQKIG